MVLSQILLTKEACEVPQQHLSRPFSLSFITPWQTLNVFTAQCGDVFIWGESRRQWLSLPVTYLQTMMKYHIVPGTLCSSDIFPSRPFQREEPRRWHLCFHCWSSYPGEWSSCHQLKVFRTFSLSAMATIKWKKKRNMINYMQYEVLLEKKKDVDIILKGTCPWCYCTIDDWMNWSSGTNLFLSSVWEKSQWMKVCC